MNKNIFLILTLIDLLKFVLQKKNLLLSLKKKIYYYQFIKKSFVIN